MGRASLSTSFVVRCRPVFVLRRLAAVALACGGVGADRDLRVELHTLAGRGQELGIRNGGSDGARALMWLAWSCDKHADGLRSGSLVGSFCAASAGATP